MSAERCGMCGNAPCTCGSGRIEGVLMERGELEELERELSALRRVAAAALGVTQARPTYLEQAICVLSQALRDAAGKEG